MKYPIILKYTYSFVISGNYYKEVVREYYELFKSKKESTIFSLNSVTGNRVNVTCFSDDIINFTLGFSQYSQPNTFQKDSIWVENSYTLKKGEKVSIQCVEKYWAYARGGENGPAILTVEWISYEDMLQECLMEAKNDKYKAITTARLLINEEMYDLAFEILLKTEMDSYELGLCYECGYGTKVDLDKALDIYLKVNSYDSYHGIERIYETRGKKIMFDNVKKTILYEKKVNIKRLMGQQLFRLRRETIL